MTRQATSIPDYIIILLVSLALLFCDSSCLKIEINEDECLLTFSFVLPFKRIAPVTSLNSFLVASLTIAVG